MSMQLQIRYQILFPSCFEQISLTPLFWILWYENNMHANCYVYATAKDNFKHCFLLSVNKFYCSFSRSSLQAGGGGGVPHLCGHWPSLLEAAFLLQESSSLAQICLHLPVHCYWSKGMGIWYYIQFIRNVLVMCRDTNILFIIYPTQSGLVVQMQGSEHWKVERDLNTVRT